VINLLRPTYGKLFSEVSKHVIAKIGSIEATHEIVVTVVILLRDREKQEYSTFTQKLSKAGVLYN
jgi:hypothetical protein